MPYLYLAITIILTVFGQLAFKYGVTDAGEIPPGFVEKIYYISRFFLNIWVVLSFISTFCAAISWLLTLTRLDLSYAYPFLSLTFILVLFCSGYFFDEPITIYKIAGAILVIIGIGVSMQK